MRRVFLSADEAIGTLKVVEKLRFSLSQFAATEALRGSLQGILIGFIIWALSKLTYASLPLLPMTIICGCGFAVIFGFSASIKTSEIKLKIKPNQGIVHSFKSTVFLLMVFYTSIAVLSPAIASALSFYLDEYAAYTYYFLSALLILVAFSIGGGIACTQHLALRFALCQTDQIPWNYARFLNYCTDRLLLQRVGGRYRFIHRLVLERFAAMPLEGRGGVDGWMSRWVDG